MSTKMSEVTDEEIQIDHPTYYNSDESGYECIDLAECYPFCLGNCVKYAWRKDLKYNAIADLEKAQWYLHRAIDDDDIKTLSNRYEKATEIINAKLDVTSDNLEFAFWLSLLSLDGSGMAQALAAILNDKKSKVER